MQQRQQQEHLKRERIIIGSGEKGTQRTRSLSHTTIYKPPNSSSPRSISSLFVNTPNTLHPPAPPGARAKKMVGNGSNGGRLLEILNVRVVGTGSKVLVLSHGFGTDQSVWSKIVPFLQRDYRIVLYDLACAGSVNPDHFDFNRYTTLDAYVDDLLAILNALRIERCSLIAHSFSAMVGVLAAISRPELFQKLILIGFSPCFLNDTGYYGGFERGEVVKVLEAMRTNYEAWVRGFAPLAVGADVPAAVREFSITLFNMRPDISLFVSKMVFDSDLRGVLEAVRTPCWVIQTSKDVSVPVSVAGYLKAHLGGRTTVEILNNTEGHLPHLSAPQILVPVLRRALSSR